MTHGSRSTQLDKLTNTCFVSHGLRLQRWKTFALLLEIEVGVLSLRLNWYQMGSSPMASLDIDTVTSARFRPQIHLNRIRRLPVSQKHFLLHAYLPQRSLTLYHSELRSSWHESNGEILCRLWSRKLQSKSFGSTCFYIISSAPYISRHVYRSNLSLVFPTIDRPGSNRMDKLYLLNSSTNLIIPTTSIKHFNHRSSCFQHHCLSYTNSAVLSLFFFLLKPLASQGRRLSSN